MDTRKRGAYYEGLAIEYLEKKGYELVERNYYCRYGEIDLIFRQHKRLVFVEVKYKKSERFGAPYEMVNKSKQAKIGRSALWYMKEKGLMEISYGFDVVSILGQQVTHYEHAFVPGGSYTM